eukprot:CAMPEP_0179262990 /NCGR_PEP_ID=MMETSP0797-20121207/27650_1 /TAXON_ID=47934 /ORGANISM="Dinophysis acuminata, Strain DAEP01" /LENGTH=359 /DNA_ID=CAMNT_0020971139 /DNA_START=18 /DNA_END=1097 /DNA_ORIENTATION=-
MSAVLEVGVSLNILQWNPHWQCFVRNVHSCKSKAEEVLDSELVKGDIDFANIVELDDESYTPPNGWSISRHTCGMDLTALIYKSDRWHIPKSAGSRATGCMVHKDRPFIVQHFAEVEAWGGRNIIVVGAHYPHTLERGTLRKGLHSVLRVTKVKEVVLIADTNEDIHVSSSHIMAAIEAPLGSLMSTPLRTTCCSNNRFKLNMTYDRIISNFGVDMDSTVLFDELPEWGYHGEFHKPIKAVIVEPTVTSTTTTTTRTTITSSTSTVTTVTTFTTTTSTSTTTPGSPVFVMVWTAVLALVLAGFGMLCYIGAKMLSTHNQKWFQSFLKPTSSTNIALCAEDERTRGRVHPETFDQDDARE